MCIVHYNTNGVKNMDKETKRLLGIALTGCIIILGLVLFGSSSKDKADIEALSIRIYMIENTIMRLHNEDHR